MLPQLALLAAATYFGVRLEESRFDLKNAINAIKDDADTFLNCVSFVSEEVQRQFEQIISKLDTLIDYKSTMSNIDGMVSCINALPDSTRQLIKENTNLIYQLEMAARQATITEGLAQIKNALECNVRPKTKIKKVYRGLAMVGQCGESFEFSKARELRRALSLLHKTCSEEEGISLDELSLDTEISVLLRDRPNKKGVAALEGKLEPLLGSADHILWALKALYPNLIKIEIAPLVASKIKP